MILYNLFITSLYNLFPTSYNTINSYKNELHPFYYSIHNNTARDLMTNLWCITTCNLKVNIQLPVGGSHELWKTLIAKTYNPLHYFWSYYVNRWCICTAYMISMQTWKILQRTAVPALRQISATKDSRHGKSYKGFSLSAETQISEGTDTNKNHENRWKPAEISVKIFKF